MAGTCTDPSNAAERQATECSHSQGERASGSADLTSAGARCFCSSLDGLLTLVFERDRQRMLKLLADPLVPAAQAWPIEERYLARRSGKQQLVEAWCRAIVGHPSFSLVEPFLKQVGEK